MTDYQLKVLREIDGERGSVDISRAMHGYPNGCTYKAMDKMYADGLIQSVAWNLQRGTFFRRTPAGDAALADADKRLLPREEVTLF